MSALINSELVNSESVRKQLLRAYYVPGPVVSAGSLSPNKIGRSPSYLLCEKTENAQGISDLPESDKR